MPDLFHDILNHLKDEPINVDINITNFIKQLPYTKPDTADGTISIFKTLDHLKIKNYVVTSIFNSEGQTIPTNDEGEKHLKRNPRITLNELRAIANITNDGLDYLEQKRREKKEDEFLERQTLASELSGQSVLDTNEFTKKNAKKNLWVSWVTLAVAGVGAFASLMDYTINFQENKRLRLKEEKDLNIQQIQKQLSEKDVTLSVQKRMIDSLLKATNDLTKYK